MFSKYRPNNPHVLDYKLVELREYLTYIERSILILHLDEQVLRTKTTLLIKVFWQYHLAEEATREQEEDIQERHPQLFDE